MSEAKIHELSKFEIEALLEIQKSTIVVLDILSVQRTVLDNILAPITKEQDADNIVNLEKQAS